jgi:hypothetical protein
MLAFRCGFLSCAAAEQMGAGCFGSRHVNGEIAFVVMLASLIGIAGSADCQPRDLD